jgi:isoleucyl-tRNA synthetase
MEGLAREVVRRVQSMRKDADFNISDQIDIRYAASDRLGKAIKKHADYIKTETLAKSMRAGEAKDGYHREEFGFDGETLTVGVRRVG